MTKWSQTRMGEAFDYLNPDPATVRLEDVAHALSHLCRFTGHTAEFYSVAEHSVRVAWELRREGESVEVQRAGLMHDAHEAYVGDVAAPLKRAMRAEAIDVPGARHVR